MTGRQITLFVLLGGLAVGGLVFFGGGWAPEQPSRPPVIRGEPTETDDRDYEDNVEIPLAGISASLGKNVYVEAAPEPLRWEDPDNPGYVVEIPYFIPWKFTAQAVLPLATGDDGGPIGVRCEDVVFRTYRVPENHVEAMALRTGDDGLVLHRTFNANEARVFGRLAAKLSAGNNRHKRVQLDRDSVLQLSDDLHVYDHAEDVEITGDEIRIHPKLGTATGTGRFRVTHAAFIVTGDGIDLNRLDANRTRIEIHRRPLLELRDDSGDSEAGSVVDFGTRDFRSASARADGRAIIRHEVIGTEDRLQIEMVDHVHVTHDGGRTLDARRLVVVAINSDDPEAPTDARAGGWRLRQLVADGAVELRHTEETRPGQVDVVMIATDLLTHEVPERGIPSTLLQGRTTLTFEGNVPIGGVDRSGGVIHASCQDRAWVGAIRGATGPLGVSTENLRRVLLSGNARVEHSGATGTSVQDVLEGDEIELIFQVAPGDDDVMSLAPAREQIAAIEFTARGNVRISGTRMQASTDLLIARGIQGLRPRISAIGPGTRVRFNEIGKGQRLLGASESEANAGRGADGERADETAAEDQWVLRHLEAEGDIDVVTSLGGPSVGMPTRLTGTALSYDELSALAELRGAPARIEAEAINGQTQKFEAGSLSMERARGLIRARGGVRGELWTAISDLDLETIRGAFRAEEPEPAAALEVETSDRIDIDIVRVPDGGGLAHDAEQWIRISGPLTAELRSERMTIDRLRARTLSFALALAPHATAAEQDERGPSPFVARPARGHRGGSAMPDPVRPNVVLSKISLEAGEMVADVSQGHARSVEAFGGVKLTSDVGHVSGERVQLNGDSRSAHVIGSATRRAEVWLYDQDGGELRNQVQSNQFTLTWDERGAQSLRAAGTPADRASAVLYHRSAAGSPESAAFERYEIVSGGPITILPDRVDASDVWVGRSTRSRAGAAWTEPATLYAPVIEVTGRNLLSAPRGASGAAAARAVGQIIARGPETYFRYRSGKDPIQIWGDRFLLDVARGEAELTGSPVKYQEGDQAHSEWTRATIDLNTGLPRLEGPHIKFRPPADPRRKADGRENGSKDDR